MDHKTIKTLLSCLLAFCAAVLFSASVQAKTPERIVSMGPMATRALLLLVPARNIAGVTTYCRMNAKVSPKPVIGTVLEPNLEQIIKLHPDLVVTIDFTRPEFADKLRSVGIKVINYGPKEDFEDLCAEFKRLAVQLEAEPKAKLITDQARKSLKATAQSVEGKHAVPTFIQIGIDPLFTIMDDTFIADMLRRAGGKNIADNVRSGLYSTEQVLAQNPEVIIMSNMGGKGDKLPQFWEKYPFLQAVKNKRLYVLDEYETCSPTPKSFALLTEKLSRLLHG